MSEQEEMQVEQFYAQLQNLKGHSHEAKVKIASESLTDEILQRVAHDLCSDKSKGKYREIEHVLMDAVFPRRDAYCDDCQSWGCWTDHRKGKNGKAIY